MTKCFVIMPFSETKSHNEEYWTKHFELLKQIVQEAGTVEVHRSQPLRGDLLGQIIADLYASSVVVADLTDQNPNVYWELGVRHALRNGTILIAEKGFKPPFDIRTRAVLPYRPNDNQQWETFRSQLKEAVLDCLKNPGKADSPVAENITGRGTLFELFRRDEAIRRMDALLLQLATNHALLNSIAECVKENQAKPNSREYITYRFALSAIELLITNRYLDQKDTFYEKLEDYYELLLNLNGQLSEWMTHAPSTEEWFLRMIEKENLDKVFGEVKDLFMAALSQLKQPE